MIEQPRMQIPQIAPDAFRHLMALDGTIAKKVDHTLAHLIKVRASQINGCAFCIAMHTEAALKDGERTERLTSLPAWRESPFYSDPERAALAWVDEITLIATHHASREAYETLARHFSKEEIAWLTLLASMINSFNRLAIASRLQYDTATVEAAKRLVLEQN
jgi:AhpD family alkylhydroperoxidase